MGIGEEGRTPPNHRRLLTNCEWKLLMTTSPLLSFSTTFPFFENTYNFRNIRSRNAAQWENCKVVRNFLNYDSIGFIEIFFNV